jgi:CRISPR/Cas system-associated exonuclease Cas4 (RecB family)
MIEFDKDKHVYSSDGKVLPSVTQILKKAGKIGYYKQNGNQQRGTDIHDLTELYDLTGFIPEEEELKNFVTGWANFKELMNVQVLKSEMLVWSEEYWYAGTLDRVVKFNDQLWVLDIKSGVKAKWHPLQLAAYAIALEECTGQHINNGIVVYLKKTGRFTTDSYNLINYRSEFIDLIGVER